MPSLPLTTIFMGERSTGRQGNCNRRRMSIAVTILSPKIDQAFNHVRACGTGVIGWCLRTSWTLQNIYSKEKVRHKESGELATRLLQSLCRARLCQRHW